MGIPFETATGARTGGRLLVNALRHHGVDTVYGVPGESYLEVLDALYDADDIRVIIARHEGAAANMAEADGKLTGRPGICFVTRGPGATHASIGVHTAMQDSTPMILFIGQVDRAYRGREGFQEIDYRAMFGSIAKWVAEIDSAARVPEMLARAFHVATAGRPGPVVLALPEDMLIENAMVADVPPVPRPQAAATPDDLDRIDAAIAQAARPLVIVGGAGWTEQACRQVADFAAALDLPVCSSFRRQDLFDNTLPHYVGHLGFGLNPKLGQRVKDADLIIAIGPRLGDVTTSGYTLIEAPRTRQQLIHIHPDPEELGHVYAADIAIPASIPGFAAGLKQLHVPAKPCWHGWRAAARQDFEIFTGHDAAAAAPQGVDMTSVVRHLSETLPPDSIITNGAGNYAVWVHRFYRYRRPRTELAPTSGAMGYGLPAAVAAKIRHPDRIVVCFAGDGCFMMYPQEIATAMQSNAPIVILIANNGLYGTIRMHQERNYPGRVIGTEMINPDFVAFAQSFGAFGERVERSEDFPAAFARAVASGRVALLDLRVDPQQITPTARLPA